MRWLGWVLLPALAGCGALERSDYLDLRSEAECKKLERCSLGYFESEFRDYEDCVRDVGDDLDDFEDAVFDNCDYDGDQARACVSRINSMSCEDYAEGDVGAACDLVWDCSG